MKILLTGFEPLDGSTINPSENIVEAIAIEPIPGVQVETRVLPVDSAKVPATLLQALRAIEPDAILCLGQASRRTVISIERVAINLLDFRIPDNVGNQVKDQPVILGGSAAYFATLPVRAIYEKLKEEGIPAELSLSAGTYLCNQVMYTVLHHLKMESKNIPAGFIHLPVLPEQAAQSKNPTPSMSLATMMNGIRIAIGVISQGER